MAPEVIMGSDYDQAADVFRYPLPAAFSPPFSLLMRCCSYGLILFDILTRNKPPVDRNYVLDPMKFEALIKVPQLPPFNPLLPHAT